MNILKQLMTAIRGGAREIGESVIDANAMVIYEQEIEDARHHLNTARESLTEVMASEMQSRRTVKGLEEKIHEREVYVVEALKKDNEALALQIAEKIAAFEEELKQQQSAQRKLHVQVNLIKSQVRKAERSIADHERELLMVKTTDSVQKATLAVSENIAANHSNLNTARQSLDRIRRKQQMTDDQLTAGDQLSAAEDDRSLQAQLAAAGISTKNSNSASVLARLKKSL